MRKHLLLCLFLLVSIAAYCQNCTLSVAISQSSPTLCSGYNVTLTATASGGTAPFRYAWSTGQTTSSIAVDKAGTYSVTVTDKTPGCQPVTQSVTIAENTTPNAPTASSVVVCANTSATLQATSPGGAYQWYDAATGGNFLASGDTYVTPPITQTTSYYVQTTVNGCTSTRTQVTAYLSSKPTVQGTSICSGDVATLIASGASSFVWYDAPTGGNVLSTSSSYTTPALTQTTTYYVSGASANGCQSPRAAVTVTVTPQPQPPTAPNVTTCSGTPANLHATLSGSGTIINWYSAPSGGVPLISSPDYTTPPLTSNTTYYVSEQTNNCESGRAAVQVFVTALPPAPANQTDTTCYNSSTTLTASAPGATSYKWYDAPDGKLLATGASFTTPVLNSSTSYYVQAGNGGCLSTFAQVTVIVKGQLPAPTANGTIICPNTSAVLTASAQGGGSFQWYSASTGGTLLASGATFTTPVLSSSTTYYVQNTQAGCVSPRAGVTVTLSATVPPPTGRGTTVCQGDSAILTASGSSGGYAWYNAQTGGTLLSTDPAYVTPALNNTTTYYVAAVANGCASTRVAVTATVNPTPTTPTVNGTTICPGMKATLTATGANGTVQWYDASFGGNLLATGNSFTTPVLNQTTTYYAVDVSGQCMSAYVPVTVTVNPSNQFSYPQNTYCVNSPNPTPTINNPNGGTFSASPAGLVFVSNTTGQINIAASTPGRYTVTFSGLGASCTVPESQSIVITTTPDATFTYNTPFCQGGSNPGPQFSGTSSGGTFSASAAGLVFVNTSTGVINLTQSTPGTYTVTNTIKATGSCPGSIYSSPVTINPGAIVNAGPNQVVGSGTTVQLSGSVTGSVSSGTWSGGTGTFSNPNILNPTYTPGAGETKAVLTLTANPGAPCQPTSATVTITFTSLPASPTVKGVTDCAGSSATLSATAPGGTYQWFDAATGGNLLWTGANFTTPALNTTTTYYVQTTINGASSNRTAATVTINAIPAAPVAPGAQTCTQTATTLTASGSSGTYQWYDAPTGGSLLAKTATYTTPVLTADATYYVQTIVNGCVSSRTQVDVTITQKPSVTSSPTGTVCSGQPENYQITADIANTTFIWSRAAVAGISNPAVSNQTSSTITETLINTGSTSVKVTYVITPAQGNCAGASFTYVVTVYPVPTVTSAASATICSKTTADYTITFSSPPSAFTWNRAAVGGVSNQPVSGQAAKVIREVLFNTSNAPVNVTYVINYNTPDCTGIPFNLVITVNPEDTITSAPTGIACSGFPQSYAITSNLPGSTYIWSRNAVKGISNPAVSNQTASTITETLVNTTLNPVSVEYDITPTGNGCTGTTFKYIVTVNPKLRASTVSSNSPICAGSDIHLTTVPVNNATYLWTGPNGFTSTDQNPVIPNAQSSAAGTYTLVYNTGGCDSPPSQTNMIVDPPPVVVAGNDTTVCILSKAVQLNGSVSGGTTTGYWKTSGTGTFSPAFNVLKAQYLPSSADTTAGFVELTLTATSRDNCALVSDSLKLTFSRLPAAIAGNDQKVCSQTNAVQLNGKITVGGTAKWTTEGTGTFTPSDTQLNAIYVPSVADIASGHVMLKLTANNASGCYTPTDSVTIFFIPPPTVYAGGVRYVLKNSTITLYPTVSETDVHYLWSPNIDINDDTLKNPVITGDVDRVYTLTVTDSRGCVASDTTLVKVSPLIKVVNTFTPNGDGINDYWDIPGLIAYVNATIDVFDRWGQRVYHSVGYPKPWDGNYSGKQVPVGVYYYIIDTHFNGQILSGYVTVIR